MMFPKDRTLYPNLNTSFTSFEALLSDLQARRLTGYVEVTFPNYTGTLLLSEGAIVNACQQDALGRTTGTAAAALVTQRAAEKDGTINVYSAFPDVVLLLNRLMDSRPLYKDLTSAFTSLDRLIAKLRTDGLTGYVEVHLGENNGLGVIYLQAGEPIESVLSVGETFTTGQEALNGIVQSVNAQGGVFHVFVEAAAAVEAATANASAGPSLEDHREALLAFWGEALARTEESVDLLAKPGRFSMAFKEVLVSRAGTYPFLDPFSAEFKYTAGHIEFEGLLPDDFNKALGDCLSDTVSKLAFQLKRADLEGRVRTRLEGISEEHAAVVDRFDLLNDVQEFVA